MIRASSNPSGSESPLLDIEARLGFPQCHLTSDYQPPVCSVEGFDFSVPKLSVGDQCCLACGQMIFDRFMLQVNGENYHTECLRCSNCSMLLEPLPSCYVKEGRMFCKACYCRQFGVKCARCTRCIQPTDWVRRAGQFVYHLACFACDSCKRQLSTGEEFALQQESRVLCKTHYMELLEGDNPKGGKQKSKRIRTTFSEEQVQVLQANFLIDSNPDGQDLERIAQLTGLSKRVTQVWFQNSRARQKKYQGGTKLANGGNGGANDSFRSSDDERSEDGYSPSGASRETPSFLEYSPDADDAASSSNPGISAAAAGGLALLTAAAKESQGNSMNDFQGTNCASSPTYSY